MDFVDVEGDIHHCGRCSAQFSLIFTFIEHRNKHCVIDHVKPSHLNDPEPHLAVVSRAGEADLSQWVAYGSPVDAPAGALVLPAPPQLAPSMPASLVTSASGVTAMDSPGAAVVDAAGESTCLSTVVLSPTLVSSNSLATAVDSSGYLTSGALGESTILKTMVVRGVSFRPMGEPARLDGDMLPPGAIHHVLSSVPSPLTAGGLPLFVLEGGGGQRMPPPARLEIPNPYLMEGVERDAPVMLVNGSEPAEQAVDDPGVPPPLPPPPPALKPPVKRRAQRLKKYVCEECGHSCSFPKDLKRHKFAHQNATFACGECERTYNRPDKLATHVRQVHGGGAPARTVACPHDGCPYRGHNKSHVQKHVQDRHSDDRPHRCQVCDYSAKHQHQLTIHLRSHTGDCPYVCSEASCQKRFVTLSDLRRHYRLHSGERPFKCDVCGLASAFKANITKHRQKMHGIGADRPKKTAGPSSDNTASSTPAVTLFTPAAAVMSLPAGEAVTSSVPVLLSIGRGRGGGRPRRRGGPRPRVHNRANYQANHVCAVCGLRFVREEAYRVHLGTHSTRGPRAVLAAPVQRPAVCAPVTVCAAGADSAAA